MLILFRPSFSGQRRTDFEENQTISDPGLFNINKIRAMLIDD